MPLFPLTLAAALQLAAPPAPTPEVGELSEQGTRRGNLEYGLGALLTGTAGGLIVFGATQFVRARDHAQFCQTNAATTGILNPCTIDPPALGFASAGLSWGFSIPLLAAAGLLFARATRLRRDAQRFDQGQLSLTPWGTRRGAGLTIALRF